VPDYVPVHKPAETLTLTASVAVTGGQLLVATGERTAGPAPALATAVVGVAGRDAAVGARFAVHTLVGAVHETTAASAIAAGDQLVSAAGGQVAPVPPVTTPTQADVTNSRAVLGTALTPAAPGARCRWITTR
jgi:hypothetical protein